MHSDPIMRRIHACVLAHVPCVLRGKPGVGKTARVLAYGRSVDAHVERWITSRCEPIDIKPRTVDADGNVAVRQPPELARIAEASERGQRGILFADELNRATRETEGALLDVFDSAPDSCAVIAAINPMSRGQSTRHLDSATANRFCHLDVLSEQRAWANAQVSGWGNGETFPAVPLEAGLAKSRALVSAFVRSCSPDNFDCEPDNPAAAGGAWPSPRSWSAAIALHGVTISLGLDKSDTAALISGCVGQGPAIEYLSFVRDADLADPEELLAAPNKFEPERGRVDRTIAAITAVIGALQREITDARWRAAWTLADRCVAADQTDAAVVAGDFLTGHWKSLAGSDVHRTLTSPARLLHPKLVKLLAP